MTKHIYIAINSPLASDGNAGTSSAYPIKTLATLFQRLAVDEVVTDETIVHFGSGTYDWSTEFGPFDLRENLIFVGDGAGQAGDDGFTLVATGTCGGGSGVGAISIPGLVANAYNLLTVEIAQTGDRRTVRDNTTSMITPLAAFSVSPAGYTYRILTSAVIFERPGAASSVPQNRPAIRGVGQRGGIASPSHNVILGPALYMANVRLGASAGAIASWGIVDSTIVFCGVELVERAGQFLAVSACSHSTIYGGIDYMIVGSQLVAPFQAGLALGVTSWTGWGLTMPVTTTRPTFTPVAGFVGYLACNGLLCEGGFWWLLGGSITEDANALATFQARDGARVYVGEWLPSTGRLGIPVLIRNTSNADIRATCVKANDGAIINLLHARLEKTNQGFGAIAVGDDGHEGTAPGVVSIAGDTGLVSILGTAASTQPTYGLAVRGGGRINWLNSYLVMSGWANDTALFSGRLQDGAPDSTHTLADYTADGISFASDDDSRIERF